MAVLNSQVLFGHIFHLPCPPQVAVYYSSLLIELCKKNAEVFPQIVSVHYSQSHFSCLKETLIYICP